jgi:hypothetical protein
MSGGGCHCDKPTVFKAQPQKHYLFSSTIASSVLGHGANSNSFQAESRRKNK